MSEETNGKERILHNISIEGPSDDKNEALEFENKGLESGKLW